MSMRALSVRRRTASATGSIVAVITILVISVSLFPILKSRSAAAERSVTTGNPEYVPIAVIPDEKPHSTKECLLSNGLAYGPFRDGQAPSDPLHPTLPFPARDQLKEDLVFLSGVTKHIRTYASSGKYAQIPSLAKVAHMKVMQGIDLSGDEKMNEKEIEAAVNLAHEGLIDSIIVGNETLLNSRVTKQALISYIKKVKEKLAPSKIPLSTAQIGSDWESNLDIAKEVDFVVVHFYPFWDGKPVEGAAAAVLTNYKNLKEKLRSKYGHDVRVVIGETGWPSAGDPHDKAIPSSENQRKFGEEFMGQACGASIEFYYFEAFDEEWKWAEGNSGISSQGSSGKGNSDLPEGDRTFSGRWIGSSWGIFQSNGKLKSQFTGLLDEPEPGPGSRVNREIFVESTGLLSAYYDMGVNSSEGEHTWASIDSGELQMSYPRGQHWGSVFITVGELTQPPRPWKDFSEFKTLSVELRAERGGEKVGIGVKNRTDNDKGDETRIVETLTTEYRPYKIPLDKLRSNHLRIPQGLRQLYVVVEFVFEGPRAETIYAKNIRYEPK